MIITPSPKNVLPVPGTKRTILYFVALKCLSICHPEVFLLRVFKLREHISLNAPIVTSQPFEVMFLILYPRLICKQRLRDPETSACLRQGKERRMTAYPSPWNVLVQGLIFDFPPSFRNVLIRNLGFPKIRRSFSKIFRNCENFSRSNCINYWRRNFSGGERKN